MAINNLMPPVQLRKPAAPVTDVNKMIEDLNLQLTTPTVQQAAPQSANTIAELLKQQLAEKLNEKIQSLTQGAPLEEVTGQKIAPAPQSNLSRIRDESPIHGSTSAGTTAFAKTAQMMNNLKATNEAINQDREYKQYRDEVDINKMIERLDLQNQYARALESDRAQNRMAMQDAAFEDRMALLNARLEAKGGGKGSGRSGSGASVNGDLNKLEAFLLKNGMTPDELAVLTTKQKQAKAAYYAGRPDKTVNREEYLRKKASLEQAINRKKMYGEAPTAEELELLEIYKAALAGSSNKTSGTEPAKGSASRAAELLMKGSAGKAAPPAENKPGTTTPVLTTDDIIKIINATQGNAPNNPKIKFDPKKY